MSILLASLGMAVSSNRRASIGKAYSVVFCNPQIASVGQPVGRMSTAERKNNLAGESSFEEQGRSKVIGPLLAWAAQKHMTVTAMFAMPFYHPVIEEGVRTALRDLHDNFVDATTEADPCLECGPGS